MKLWVVGRYTRDRSWEFFGAFDSEELAVFHCSGDDYFVGPCILNELVDEQTISWPGCYYPMARVENVVLGDFDAS